MTKLQEAMINYRAENCITQGELADRCKLSRKYIGMIENGKYTPSPVVEAKIRLVVNKEV